MEIIRRSRKFCKRALFVMFSAQMVCAYSDDSQMLDNPPWENGESMVFSIRSASDRSIKGYAVLSVRDIERDGRDFWRIRFQVLSDPSALSIVDIDKDEFLPAYSLYQSKKLGEVEAKYQNDGVEVERRLKEYRGSLQRVSQTYDVVQSVYLMRLFPITLGYQKRVYVVNAMQPTKQIPTLFRVDEIKEIDTVDGRKLCYRVSASLDEEHYRFWISADEKRTLYKLQNRPGIILELSSISNVATESRVEYTSEQHGFQFDVKDEWFAFRKTGVPGMESREQVLFMLPDPDCDFSLIRHPRFGELQAVVDGSINWLKNNRKHFKLDGTSMRNFTLGELRGHRFEGTFEEDDERYRVYHAILADDQGLYIFTGDGPDQQMRAFVDGMDEIVGSMKLIEVRP
jgi:hypothetical protein